MGLTSWIKGLFKPEILDDFEINDYEYSCPKCGCKKLGYSSVISNFASVIINQDDPYYTYMIDCPECGFKVTSEDEKETFRQVHREKK